MIRAMTREFRRDRFSAELKSPQKTADGYLFADAIISRVGVYPYRRADGSIQYEYRPADEVLSADSVATVAGMPLTIDHPTERVDATNVEKYGVGVFDKDPLIVKIGAGGHVKVGVVVQRADAVAAIEAGKSQLSPGYHVDLDEIPGTYEGQRYDVVQRNIVYNHGAAVDAGRQGPTVSLRMDEAELVVQDEAPAPITTPRSGPMAKVRIDGTDWEFEDSAKAAAVGNLKTRVDAMTGERDAAVQRADTLEAERDAERKRADDLKAELAAVPKHDFGAALTEYQELLPIAKHLKVDAKGKEPQALRADIVGAYLGDKTERTDAQVDAAYAVVVKAVGDEANASSDLADALHRDDEDSLNGGERTDVGKAEDTYFSNLPFGG